MKNKPDMMLVVGGDHNDADWITKITPITQDQIDRFLPLITAIKAFKPYQGMSDPTRRGGMKSTFPHNWPVGEYCCREDLGEKTIVGIYQSDTISEDLINEFDETFVPHSEDYNIHTIHEIYVVKYDKHLYTGSHSSF